MSHHKPLSPVVVQPLLRGRFGDPYLWAAACPSTQDLLDAPELPEGAVAATDHQTAGRGRHGRRWQDEPGAALLFSLLLQPSPSSQVAQLSLVCALAVAETIEDAASLPAQVKWPNDVLVEGRKVAGILLEGRQGAVVCGIGINVNQTGDGLPPDPRTPATSLRLLTDREHDRGALLAALLERLELRYDAWSADGLAPLMPELEHRDALLDGAVTVAGLSGTAAGIAPDGRLRVIHGDGETLVASGEVKERLVSG